MSHLFVKEFIRLNCWLLKLTHVKEEEYLPRKNDNDDVFLLNGLTCNKKNQRINIIEKKII